MDTGLCCRSISITRVRLFRVVALRRLSKDAVQGMLCLDWKPILLMAAYSVPPTKYSLKRGTVTATGLPPQPESSLAQFLLFLIYYLFRL
jgi:hypothetical protein